MRSTVQLAKQVKRNNISPSLFKVLPEVEEALHISKAVVALESTILAHGLPYNANIQLAKEISKIVRSKGAIPATIAVKDGICRVGLSEEELEDLAVSGVEKRADKCSTRDLPFAIAREYDSSNLSDVKHHWGATTVASTMRLAHLAGISTFVTGGTGGVHRGAEISMDISADLIELSRTPVVVVSAGVKSILDIQKTLETLETYGVPTAAYGTNEFPAFFSPTSGISAPSRVDNADEVARAFLASVELGLPNGMLIAVPNIDPAGDAVEIAIRDTIEEADKLGIKGRDVTPFILKKVSSLTGGDSLRSNTALVKRNAEVGTDIALSIAHLKNSRGEDKSFYMNDIFREGSHTSKDKGEEMSRVVVMGGSVVDIVAKSNNKIISCTSNPGTCSESEGGVGRNIAEVLGQLGAKPIFCTAVGNDSRGKTLRQRMEDDYDITKERQKINVISGANTATYLAILGPDGDLLNAIADMDVLNEIPVPNEATIASADYLVVDANPTVGKLVEAAQTAYRFDTTVIFDPTSVPKAAVVGRNSDFLSCVSYAFPNVDELLHMTKSTSANLRSKFLYENDFALLKEYTKEVLGGMHSKSAHLVVTLGAKGVFLASKAGDNHEFEFKHFPAKQLVQVSNCTGAGDTLVGVFVNSLLNDNTIVESIEKGMIGAVKSLELQGGAIPKLSIE